MSAELDKAISHVVNSGAVEFGVKHTLRNCKLGRGKLVVVANNCPSKNDIIVAAKSFDIPIIFFPRSSTELGATCGRPHKIAAFTVHNAGSSRITALVENPDLADSPV